ncbi:tyrosine-type recombinase/integrase [Streptomyces lydicus]|uniref:tyrosine-type recombinase/integrase n=1 Tax=Streptomyces lydicus TaxID=47763 RepID=UPI00379479F2
MITLSIAECDKRLQQGVVRVAAPVLVTALRQASLRSDGGLDAVSGPCPASAEPAQRCCRSAQARYDENNVRSAEDTRPARDAEVWLVRKEAEIIENRWQDPNAEILFGEYATAWLKERDYAATTRERKESALRLHIMPTFARSPLTQITTPHVRRWRSALLDNAVGESTVVKAYQILRAVMNTAVDDGLIQRNPCRIKGAGVAKTAERPYLTVPEVYRIADAVPSCFRVLVLLAAFTGLRFGELAALQRHDVDLERRTIAVRRSQAETRTQGLTIKTPKSSADIRTVAFPASLVEELTVHLSEHAESGRSGLIFVGQRGGRLRRNNFRRVWLSALRAAGLSDVHFHDLRHTGNTWPRPVAPRPAS